MPPAITVPTAEPARVKKMTTATPDKGAAEKQGLQQRSARIGKQVLEAMGCPAALQGVRVWPLWGDYYRVNICTAMPALTRRYEATTGDGV
jgi:hypothetical protein